MTLQEKDLYKTNKNFNHAENSIYLIMNTILNKPYIGRSVRPQERIRTHFLALRSGKGYKEMQKDYDKYGECSFDFRILETHNIDEFDPREREDYYINKFNSLKEGYNKSPGIKKGSFSMSTNVNEDLYNIIKEISANEGKTASQWIKGAIEEKIKRGL